MMITEKEFRTLMTMPHLESLIVHTVKRFREVELPDAINLSYLELEYDFKKTDIASLCQAMKKMLKLKTVYLWSILSGDGSWCTDANVLKLFIQVAIMISSQNKDLVLLKNRLNKNVEKLKIARTNGVSSDTANETLNLAVRFEDEASFLEQVKVFVRNNLDNYHVITL